MYDVSIDYLRVNYSLLLYTSACVFNNSTTGGFDKAGCQIGKCSSPFATQCLCSHLTSFSNTFKAPKTKFDANAFSLKSLDANPIAFSFCISCLCIYLIMYIYCLRKDLDDKKLVCTEK